MLEKQAWRDFAAVTISVAVLGIGLGSTLPLTALVLSGRGIAPDVVGWVVAASALGGIAGTIGPIAAGVAMKSAGSSGVAAVMWLIAVGFLAVVVRSKPART